MACPAVITGDRFLTRAIEHIDCQAQLLGTFGYQSLAQPGSLASSVMIGLLTIFVALFAIRFLFGPGPEARDVVFQTLFVGVALTLAFSWPAFQTVIYGVVVEGPAEISAAVLTPVLPDTGSGFIARIQGLDTSLVQLIEIGTGRNTGAILGEGSGATFAGTSLQDDAAFGWARVIFLASTIGTVGLLRIVAGLLLALAPLAAGLLLFDATRGLFVGWLRALIFTILGLVGISAILALEITLAEPWLADALRVRQAGYGTPSAPLEILALMMAVLLIQLGMLWVMARLAFMRSSPLKIPLIPTIKDSPNFDWTSKHGRGAGRNVAGAPSRVERTADSVERLQRHEEQLGLSPRTQIISGHARTSLSIEESGAIKPGTPKMNTERLGSTWRSDRQQPSRSAKRRDGFR